MIVGTRMSLSTLPLIPLYSVFGVNFSFKTLSYESETYEQ